MPKFQRTTDEVERFELIKNGYYPFEVTGYEQGISTGKTQGCDYVGLRVKFFTDATFTKPIGMWTERLTFPQSMDRELNRFLTSVLNSFAICTGMHGEVGQEVEFTEGAVIGLRGVAYVKQVKRKDSGELTNRVDRWATDKEKFARVVTLDEEETKPF